MKTFDPTKPVKTVGGSTARIICSDRKGDFPIIALIEEKFIHSYKLNGRHCDEPGCENDLVNIPQKIKVSGFLNVYPEGVVFNPTRKEADENALSCRVACIPLELEYKEGQGL